MDNWGFVIMAYGVVWFALLLYLFSLKGRMRKARAKLSQIRSTESSSKHAK